MRDPPGDRHMIDPVTGGATATAAPQLQLVAPSASTPGATAPSTADGVGAGPSSTSPSASVQPASVQPATRVYVDRGDNGVYVYRLVDVATGQVLVELPREASQSLKVMDNYVPGAVASASA